ncbi:MAG: type II CRISPR RNA-guided endonuclease Cas9, partial [Alphaproteobacteria bacterium]|nr:type II CRISPR RNA-guided endonuclease Cas9 [Alphaproteobacteria bacterium]
MSENNKIYRTFGFDIGTASIGWSVIETAANPEEGIKHDDKTGEVIESDDSTDYLTGIKIVSSGVRMFNEPIVSKTFALLNLQRRSSRLARRRTRRVAERKEKIKKLLLSLSWYKPQDFEGFSENGEINYDNVFQRVILANKLEPEKHNIFYLRVKGLDEKLTHDELAVVLYNLAKTRGFKSSKKIKKGKDELSQIEDSNSESGKVLASIKVLKAKIREGKIRNGHGEIPRTFAEYIYFANKERELNSYRNKGSDYSNSILRSGIEEEIKFILNKQRSFYPELTESFEKEFLKTMLFQREVYFNRDSIGKCTYEREEYRSAKATFSAEYYVALGKLINLRIKPFKQAERELNKEEIDDILKDALNGFKTFTYKQIRRKLKLSPQDFFKGLRYTQDSQSELSYDDDKIEDKKKFIEFKHTKEVDKYLKEALSQENHAFIINRENYKVLDSLVQFNFLYNEKEIKKEIEKAEHLKNIPQEIKDAIIYCNLEFKETLALSLKAIYKITPLMEKLYDPIGGNGLRMDAKRAIDILINKGELVEFEPKKYDRLPALESIKEEFYVPKHAVIVRAISQVRKTFNAMVDKYGKPDLVNIELLRELKNPSDRKEHINKREDNTIERERIRKELKDMGLPDTEANILMCRLWEEQGHYCPYCQKPISHEEFRKNDNSLQVDHIIPESLSFDNSQNNKVLVHTPCNQSKAQRTPYLWKKDNNQEWNSFKNWVNNSSLPRAKVDKLLNQQSIAEITQGFLERQRNDSAYITILIKDFIEQYFTFPSSESKSKKPRHVYATKGALTKILRDAFEFKKYRQFKDLQEAQAKVLYSKIVWNKEKNPAFIEYANSLQKAKNMAEKAIREAKKQGNQEPKEAKKIVDENSKKLDTIKKAFMEYLPKYFADSTTDVKPAKEIEEYVNSSVFSSYLAELKFTKAFDEELNKMEADFIGDKHHALDAILVGLANPSMIQGVGTLANQAEDIIKAKINDIHEDKERNKVLRLLYKGSVGQKVKFLIDEDNKDWVQNYLKSQNIKTYKPETLAKTITDLTITLKPNIKKSLDKIFISRQPNRKIMGRLHEDTIYSAKETRKENGKLTKRINVSDVKDVEKIVGSKDLKDT